MTKGQRVEVERQEFPGRRFAGEVLQVRANGQLLVRYESWGVFYSALFPVHRVHAI